MPDYTPFVEELEARLVPSAHARGQPADARPGAAAYGFDQITFASGVTGDGSGQTIAMSNLPTTPRRSRPIYKHSTASSACRPADVSRRCRRREPPG